MLHLNGSAEPNIKLSIDSNASIAANTIDPLKVFQFHHIQCQFEQATSHQIERHNRATFKRPNTLATLPDKSTMLTVARAPKYDKQTTESPRNRIHARRRAKRRRRQKPLDVERTCRHPDQ
jgi:hypothetical protein